MNIDEYRALVAQEAKTEDSTQEEQPPVVAEETKTEETKVEEKAPAPTKIEIDGEELTPEQIKEWKQGYLRTQDYTKKTQELSSQKKEMEQALKLVESLRQNPELAKQVSQQVKQPDLDPTVAKIKQLENQLYDMMLEREIDQLTNKYPDFEIKEVLEIADKKQLTNLEDAYLLAKSMKPQGSTAQQSVNIDEMKAQLRAELLKEIEAERGATQTIISSQGQGTKVTTSEPKLSEAEKTVAKKSGMSYAEYAKWRDG